MGNYDFFAMYYDSLTKNVDYAGRADYISELLRLYNHDAGITLDLACGTGSLTLLQHIEVISDVPDLMPYIEQADIIVLPIFSGSGMKVKTCEALMYGKNIVGTKEAFEGYTADYNRLCGLCNTDEEFIACLNNIAAHPIPRFNTYARQIYLEHYSYQAVQNLFRTLILPAKEQNHP